MRFICRQREVRDRLFKIALGNSAAFLRDMVSFRLGELFQSEDCSIGNHSEGLSLFNDKMQVNDDVLSPLRDTLLGRVAQVHGEVIDRINQEQQKNVLECSIEFVRQSLVLEEDLWKVTFPGRYILQRFSGKYRLGKWPAFQNVLIDRLSKDDFPIEKELYDIFETITRSSTDT